MPRISLWELYFRSATTKGFNDTHDKELLAIVDCLKSWRHYIKDALHQIQVISNHNNLELFTTTKVLNR